MSKAVAKRSFRRLREWINLNGVHAQRTYSLVYNTEAKENILLVDRQFTQGAMHSGSIARGVAHAVKR
jgi:hypothetical protein